MKDVDLCSLLIISLRSVESETVQTCVLSEVSKTWLRCWLRNDCSSPGVRLRLNCHFSLFVCKCSVFAVRYLVYVHIIQNVCIICLAADALCKCLGVFFSSFEKVSQLLVCMCTAYNSQICLCDLVDGELFMLCERVHVKIDMGCAVYTVSVLGDYADYGSLIIELKCLSTYSAC